MALAAAPLRRFQTAPTGPPPSSTSHRYARLLPPHSRRRAPLLVAAAAAAAAPLTTADTEARKHDLLRAVQETRRGSAASSDQRAAIEEAIVCVEELGAGEGAPLDLAALDGTWRLCYTSASDVLVLFEAAEKLPLLQEQEGATLMVSAKFDVLSKRNIFLQFEEVAVENIKISEQLQALIAPAVLPRSFFSLQILQFLRTFRAQVPVSAPERRSPGGLYYLSYLDRDMLLGRSVGGGGVFVFTRAQPLL